MAIQFPSTEYATSRIGRVVRASNVCSVGESMGYTQTVASSEQVQK